MRPAEREALRATFGYRCAYCGVGEVDVGAELTVDHFQPQSRGGSDEPENWVYCCHACNEFKADHWEPESLNRILHPLRDPVAEHFTETPDGILVALTATGAFHIRKLRLNRTTLVAHRLRRRLVAVRSQAEAEAWERLDRLEEQMQELRAQIEHLGPRGPSEPM